jgi:hypothetical protein
VFCYSFKRIPEKNKEMMTEKTAERKDETKKKESKKM